MKTKRWVAALLCVLLIGSLFPVSAFATDAPEGNAVFAERSEGIASPDNMQETEPEPQTDKTASVQDTFEEESTGISSENTETEKQALESVEIAPDGNEPTDEQNDAPAKPDDDGFTVSLATPSDAMQETEADISPAAAFGAVPGGIPGGTTTGYSLTLDENWAGGTSRLFSDITSYELPSAIRPGKTFYGWSTIPSGKVEYRAGDTVTLTGDLTLYAVWWNNNASIFYVTFYANGGTGTMEPGCFGTQYPYTGYTIPDCGFTREGYTFKGWATAPDVPVEYLPGDIYKTLDDLFLFAVWEQNDYHTVTYKVVNGTWSDGTIQDKTETVSAGTSPKQIPVGMKPSAGYTGGAWNADPASTTISGDATFTYTFEEEQSASAAYTIVGYQNQGPDGAIAEVKISGVKVPENTGGTLEIAPDAQNVSVEVKFNQGFTFGAGLDGIVLLWGGVQSGLTNISNSSVSGLINMPGSGWLERDQELYLIIRTQAEPEPSDDPQGATIGGINVDVSINGSQATIENLSSDVIDKAAATSGSKLTIDVSAIENSGVPVLVERINMPMQVGEDILAVLLSNANNKNSVEFLMPGKGISMDAKAFNTVVDQASDASTISVEAKDIEKINLNMAQQEAINQIIQGKDTNIASLIDVNVLAGGTPIHDLKGGTATIAVDLGSSTEQPKPFRAFYLSEDGKVEQQPTNSGEWLPIYDSEGKIGGYKNKITGEFLSKYAYPATLQTRHCSAYAFIYETPDTYTVTFDANGGSVMPTSAATGTDGKLASLPTPTRSGSYSFNGWYTAASGGTKVTVDNVYTADTTVYAHWTYTGGGGGGETYYTLTFNTNGGSAISSVSGTYGKVIDLDKYVPTKDGYNFGGWYSNSALTSPVDEIKLTGNKTVYAKWHVENPQTGADLPFTDIKATDWSYENIAYVYEKGLMQGTSEATFAPQLSTSRAMIVTILWRLEGAPVVNYAMSFTDVAPDQWYTEAIRWAQANGIVSGYSAEKFGTNDPITREQMAVILYRYADFKGYDVSAKADLSKFADSDKIGGWAVDAIAWSNANNLVNGVSATELAPQGKATREQVAAILHRFCENIVK